MPEPNVDRRALTLWMTVSLIVAVLLLWLGIDIHPSGTAGARTLPASPVTGAMGFTFLLAWAAFAYAAAITTPRPGSETGMLVLILALPLAVVLLLGAGLSPLALLVAVVWLGALVWTAWKMARRQALAGIMMLPLIGAAIASLLLSLTLWAIP
ncbi:hypothetical protein [Guyparkeria sp.]|uniref:hypothetical protein n=1 Tax=Guyparkeria sp. TaxID=2035736 RepID=UPI003568874A